MWFLHYAATKDSPTFRKGSEEWKLNPEIELRKHDILIEKSFQVDFLSDAVGTLAVQNSAGAISASDLHRAVMVTQAMRFARVMKTAEWIRAMVEG